MHAHARPKVFEVRIYESEEDGYLNKESYANACLATQTLVDGEYEISLLHGEFNPKAMTAVLTEAKKHGAKKLWYLRHGKLRSILIR